MPDDTHIAEAGIAAAPLRQTGLECLVYAAAAQQVSTSVESLRHEYRVGPGEPSDGRIVALARKLGFKARTLDTDAAGLRGLGPVFPVLARLSNGNVVVVLGLRPLDGDLHVAVMDPLANRTEPVLMPWPNFAAAWSGRLILLRRRASLEGEAQPFGLGWFVPELLRHKGLLRDVVLAALAIQIVGLAVPVFFRVVLDRVLVHQSEATLIVLTLGVLAALLFEAAFTYLRQFILLHATNKIDIRLAMRVFRHLLSLPVSYFETVPAGVTIRHLQQTEKIRSFLTGRLLVVGLELATLVVYLPLLFWFSSRLTLLVLGFGIVLAGIVAALIGPFRVRLRNLYNAEAKRQAMLVETVHGLRTVKSLTLEPTQQRAWEERSAAVVEFYNRVGTIAAGGSALTGFLEKAMSVSVIAVGALEAFTGSISVGTLIAFQMLAGRVISPLVQSAALVQDYQDTLLSVRMLGDVMNRAPERKPAGGGLRPAVAGKIEFDRVTFRYAPGGTPALDQVGLRIPARCTVGVVGRSGSGKSTVAKLLQSLYPLQEGVIRIDGADIREFDLAHLRRNICVVPQETFIFHGTVRENIALADPAAPIEAVAAAARQAGADEFIELLPQGYDTELEEGGQNLSGGQRQRLAIARAMLLKPPVLVLDEATSSLDPDSEAIFLDNLAAIAAGRTTIIISHRLNSLVACDAIVVLDHGRIVDAGKHGELLERCDIYRTLWKRQNRHL